MTDSEFEYITATMQLHASVLVAAKQVLVDGVSRREVHKKFGIRRPATLIMAIQSIREEAAKLRN